MNAIEMPFPMSTCCVRITNYDMNGILSIFTPEKEIVIEGRDLNYIGKMLYKNMVKWIRESGLSFDPGFRIQE